MYPFSVTDSFDIAAYGEPEPYAAKITGEILEFLEKQRARNITFQGGQYTFQGFLNLSADHNNCIHGISIGRVSIVRHGDVLRIAWHLRYTYWAASIAILFGIFFLIPASGVTDSSTLFHLFLGVLCFWLCTNVLGYLTSRKLGFPARLKEFVRGRSSGRARVVE